MAASAVLDMPEIITFSAGPAEQIDPLHVKNIRMSDVRPKYDDRLGSMPPDRMVSLHELLNPTVMGDSDNHIGLSNAYVGILYKVGRYIRAKLKKHIGDFVDLQGIARPDMPLKFEHLLVIDQDTHVQGRHGTYEANTDGNHDQQFSTVIEKLRQAGINMFRAIRTKYPDHQAESNQSASAHDPDEKGNGLFKIVKQFALPLINTFNPLHSTVPQGRRDEVDLHGHQIESATMALKPTKIAVDAYDDMVSKGEGGEATAKASTKWITGGVGRDHALKFLSWWYDAIINTGHLHTVEKVQLPYKWLSAENLKHHLVVLKGDFKPFSEDYALLKRSGVNLLKTASLGTALWLHNSGRLETYIKRSLIPTLERALESEKNVASGFDAKHETKDLFIHAAYMFLPATQVRMLTTNLSQPLLPSFLEPLVEKTIAPLAMWAVAPYTKNGSGSDGVKSKVTEVLPLVAKQILSVLKKDPRTSIMDELTLQNMWMKFKDERIPAKTASGATTAEFNVYGAAGIDDKATGSMTFADTGYTYPVDFRKILAIAEERGVIPKKSLVGNDLILDHFQEYGGMHRKTLQKFKLFIELSGTLPDEEAIRYAHPPQPEEMLVVKVRKTGDIEFATPDGKPLVRAERARESELIRPHQILRELEKIDLRTANDLRAQIASDSDLERKIKMERLFGIYGQAAPIHSESEMIKSMPPYMIPHPYPSPPGMKKQFQPFYAGELGNS